MKIEELGRSAKCSQCGQLSPPDQLIYEGEELEPTCRNCLAQLDPARLAILDRINSLRKPKLPGF